MYAFSTCTVKSNLVSCNYFYWLFGIITVTVCLDEQINPFTLISWTRKYVAFRWFTAHASILTILAITSQSDEMPDTTVLRAARTSSVINLKTISEVGNNLTYPGSFVSLSNTYDQRLKKVPFERPKNSKESLDTRSVQAKCSVAMHSSDLDRLFLSQSFTCPLHHLCMNALPFQTSWNE